MNKLTKLGIVAFLAIIIGIFSLPKVTEIGVDKFVNLEKENLKKIGLSIKEVKSKEGNYFHIHKKFIATIVNGYDFISYINKNNNVLPKSVASKLLEQMENNKDTINKKLNGSIITAYLDANIYHNNIKVNTFLTDLADLTNSLKKESNNKIGKQVNEFLKNEKLGATFNSTYTGNIKNVFIKDVNKSFSDVDNNKELNLLFKNVYLLNTNKFGKGSSFEDIKLSLISKDTEIKLNAKNLIYGVKFDDKFNNSINSSIDLISINMKQPISNYYQNYTIKNLISSNKVNGSDILKDNFKFSLGSFDANLSNSSGTPVAFNIKNFDIKLNASKIKKINLEKILELIHTVPNQQNVDELIKNTEGIIQSGFNADLNLGFTGINSDILNLGKTSFSSVNKVEKNNVTLKTIMQEGSPYLYTSNVLTINKNDKQKLLGLNPFFALLFKGAEVKNNNLIVNFVSDKGKVVVNGRKMK